MASNAHRIASMKNIPSVESAKRICRIRVDTALGAFKPVALTPAMADALSASGSDVQALVAQGATLRMHPRFDFDAVSAELVAGFSLGDCMAPVMHDGDLLWFHKNGACLEGDLLAFFAEGATPWPAEYVIKVVERIYGEWMAIARNDPPHPWHESFRVIGPLLAWLHLDQPTPRSAERQHQLDEAAAQAAAIGYEWSATYLKQVFTHGTLYREGDL
jgi:phage repressor protein C with HTH and peptisase S24 domain